MRILAALFVGLMLLAGGLTVKQSKKHQPKPPRYMNVEWTCSQDHWRESNGSIGMERFCWRAKHAT